jgi:hypothetical protein
MYVLLVRKVHLENRLTNVSIILLSLLLSTSIAKGFELGCQGKNDRAETERPVA